MVVGAVDYGILGWDFLLKYHFDLLWTNSKCVLFCGKTKSSYPLHVGQLGRLNRHAYVMAPEISGPETSRKESQGPR